MLLLVALVLLASMLFNRSLQNSQNQGEMAYGDFYSRLTTGKLAQVTVIENDATVKVSGDNKTYNVKLPTRDRESLTTELQRAAQAPPVGYNLKLDNDRSFMSGPVAV
jgi:ATP-dependent Zn protease